MCLKSAQKMEIVLFFTQMSCSHVLTVKFFALLDEESPTSSTLLFHFFYINTKIMIPRWYMYLYFAFLSALSFFISTICWGNVLR